MGDEERSWQALIPNARRVIENALGTLIGGALLALGAQIIGVIDLSTEQVAALVVSLAAVASPSS